MGDGDTWQRVGGSGAQNEDSNEDPCIEASKNCTEIHKNFKNVVFRAACLCPVSLNPFTLSSKNSSERERQKRERKGLRNLSIGFLEFLLLLGGLSYKGLISTLTQQNHFPGWGTGQWKEASACWKHSPFSMLQQLQAPSGTPR